MHPVELESRPSAALGKWGVLLAVGVGGFMSSLDGSVVNTILPVIRGAFGSNVASIEWVITVYLLVVSGLLLSVGRLGDLRGNKSVYVGGFAGFILASGLCGLAPSVTALIAFRGLQAIAASMLFANAPAILTKNFPSSQRGQALGLQSTMIYLGLTVGPSLGGWLASHLGWRSVFYVNVPVGLLALLLAQRFIPPDSLARDTEPFDLAGAGTFILGLVTFLLALNQGYSWGWTSWPILSLLATAALALIVFITIEQHAPHPMLDLSLFRRRLFAASTASAILNYMSLYGIVFLLPFYLIQGRGLTPVAAGVLLTAQPVAMAIVAPISGTLSDRIGSWLPSSLGMAILAAGILLLSRLGPQSSLTMATVGLAIAGVGTGIFVSPNTSALMGSAPRERQGIASGVLATARNVGMVIGVGMAGAIFTTSLAHGQMTNSSAALYDGVSLGLLAAAGAAGLGAITSLARGS